MSRRLGCSAARQSRGGRFWPLAGLDGRPAVDDGRRRSRRAVEGFGAVAARRGHAGAAPAHRRPSVGARARLPPAASERTLRHVTSPQPLDLPSSRVMTSAWVTSPALFMCSFCEGARPKAASASRRRPKGWRGACLPAPSTSHPTRGCPRTPAATAALRSCDDGRWGRCRSEAKCSPRRGRPRPSFCAALVVRGTAAAAFAPRVRVMMHQPRIPVCRRVASAPSIHLSTPNDPPNNPPSACQTIFSSFFSFRALLFSNSLFSPLLLATCGGLQYETDFGGRHSC